MATEEKQLHLTIHAREGVLFDSDVVGVSSRNEAGPFDVLARHTNFISILNAPINITNLDGSVQTFPADNAIMKVVENQVDVYVGIKTGLR